MCDSLFAVGGDDDRGQSELLGFVLIFGVVTLAIALVGLAGFTGLDSAQDYQRTTNAEQAFTALTGNIDDVVHAGAPSRSTEVRVADGRLSLEDAETITIEAGGENTTVETQPIVYDSGSDTTITYYNGALIRQDAGSAVMFGEPNFVISENESILPVVATNLADGGPVGGTTSVDVQTTDAGTEIFAQDGSVEEVTLNISTAHSGVWEQYFEQYRDGPVSNIEETEDGLEVTIETERLHVTIHHVDVELQ